MITPNCTQIEQLAKDYNLIPICKEIYADIITPIMLLRKLSQASNSLFLLESVEGGEKWGRYSFLGYNPKLQISCKSGQVIIRKGEKETITSESPYKILRELMKEYRSPKLPDMPPFTGGLVGYFSYGMFRYSEPILKLEESEFNDMELLLFDRIIAYDHLKQKIKIVANIKTDMLMENYGQALADIEVILRVISEPLRPEQKKAYEVPEFGCNTSKEEFIQMVMKTKKHITSGDIFQAVISRRFEADYSGSLLGAYRVLRTTNPSPYMVFFQNKELQLISTSPETMVRLQDGRLSTFPIAGSRPRGKDRLEDESLEKELLNDEKELSEHNMLVDLARNDLGRISKTNSIHLADYMKVKRYSKIMHITSEVEGILHKDKDAMDAIEALLPAGTLSGAPKIRACEIIEDLEKEPRGIYGGAVGYIDFSGNLDTCIAIRMAVKKNGKVYVQSGSGIVADSNPEKEYKESFYKAGAVIEAVKNAGEVESNDINY